MLNIDPDRIGVLQRVAASKRKHAEAMMQGAADDMRACETIRKEILAATRRHEKSGKGEKELAALRERKEAAELRSADAYQRSDIAQEEAKAARKLVTRCEAFLRGQYGGDHAV